MHWPVRTSYIQPCHGHARRVPESLPSLSGPPLWAQTSPSACTRSPTRTRTTRAPSASTSIGRPTATSASGTRMAVTRPLSRRRRGAADRKSTRLNSSHLVISYAGFCLKKKNNIMIKNKNKNHAIMQKVPSNSKSIVTLPNAFPFHAFHRHTDELLIAHATTKYFDKAYL